MPKKTENTFSPLHIPVLVNSKNVFCHFVQIFMGILEICEPKYFSYIKQSFIFFIQFFKRSENHIMNGMVSTLNKMSRNWFLIFFYLIHHKNASKIYYKLVELSNVWPTYCKLHFLHSME